MYACLCPSGQLNTPLAPHPSWPWSVPPHGKEHSHTFLDRHRVLLTMLDLSRHCAARENRKVHEVAELWTPCYSGTHTPVFVYLFICPLVCFTCLFVYLFVYSFVWLIDWLCIYMVFTCVAFSLTFLHTDWPVNDLPPSLADQPFLDPFNQTGQVLWVRLHDLVKLGKLGAGENMQYLWAFKLVTSK